MPFGFPSGATLVENILSPSRAIEALIFHKHAANLYGEYAIAEFKRALKMSGRVSIDAFLEHNPRFMGIGKLAIASCLIPHEVPDKLFEGPNWYKTLFNHMNSRIEEFDQNKLSIITFNYDRSLEHFLVTALENAYESVNGTQAALLVSKIPIIHLHGSLGTHPSLTIHSKSPAMPLPYISKITSGAALEQAANGIKVIHEDIDKYPEFSKASELLENAQKICFLGFGYDEINLRRLNIRALTNPMRNNPVVFGTAYKLPPVKQQWIARQIRDIHLSTGTIDDLLGEMSVL